MTDTPQDLPKENPKDLADAYINQMAALYGGSKPETLRERLEQGRGLLEESLSGRSTADIKAAIETYYRSSQGNSKSYPKLGIILEILYGRWQKKRPAPHDPAQLPTCRIKDLKAVWDDVLKAAHERGVFHINYFFAHPEECRFIGESYIADGKIRQHRDDWDLAVREARAGYPDVFARYETEFALDAMHEYAVAYQQGCLKIKKTTSN